MEGLGGDGHIRSFSSIFPDAPLDTLGPRAPYCVIFVWGGMSTRTLRQKYQPPSSQPFCPRSHHLRAPPALSMPGHQLPLLPVGQGLQGAVPVEPCFR